METDIEAVGADKSVGINAKNHDDDPLKPMITEDLSEVIAPHPSYEGFHRFDPRATWTAKEESAVVWKTDLFFLSWVCIMVSHTIVSQNVNHMLMMAFSSLGCS